MKRLGFIPLILLVLLASCQTAPPSDDSLHLFDSIANADITSKVVTMKVGDSIQLRAMYLKTKDVTADAGFSSGKVEVATVGNVVAGKGEIQAVAVGETAIEALYYDGVEDHTAAVTIKVEAP